jgi:type 1 fimbria pilin
MMKMNVNLLLGMILLLGGVYHANVLATTCQVNTGSYSLNIGNVNVQRDLAIGSPIGTVFYGSQSPGYTCTSSGTEGTWAGIQTSRIYDSTVNGRQIYKTNVPGIGIAIGTVIQTGSYAPYESWLTSNNWLGTGWNSFAGSVAHYTFQPMVQLVKIGPITSGALTVDVAKYITNSNVERTGSWLTEIPIKLTGSITSVACSISTPVIQVPLDDILANDLKSVNATFKPKNFNVGLSCDAGAHVNVKMTGTKNTETSTDGVLQLTNVGSPGVATGVGIQILYNNDPLALNKNIQLKTSSGGQETFPFVARYYQTKNAVTTGVTNAAMVLDITYQ